MMRVGLIGWRGMVGSVLMQRMREEKDFEVIDPVFFTTSNPGGKGPDIGKDVSPLKDAKDINELKSMDAIISCQGGDYTKEVYGDLRAAGWQGYWIDAASTLRMKDDAIIILDPVNKNVIKDGLAKGVKTYVGGNCTVSLMLMAIGGLFDKGLIEWISPMTYQAASGAGARNMRELIQQMGAINGEVKRCSTIRLPPSWKSIARWPDFIRSDSYPVDAWPVPLAGSLIPWIDVALESGQSKEEWKAQVECNKILGRSGNQIPIDGLCVRIGAMRCHSQALTIKMTKDVPLDEIHAIIAAHNDWVKVVPNDREITMEGVDPGGSHRHADRAGRSHAQAQYGATVPFCLHRWRPVAVGRCRAAASYAAHPD